MSEKVWALTTLQENATTFWDTNCIPEFMFHHFILTPIKFPIADSEFGAWIFTSRSPTGDMLFWSRDTCLDSVLYYYGLRKPKSCFKKIFARMWKSNEFQFGNAFHKDLKKKYGVDFRSRVGVFLFLDDPFYFCNDENHNLCYKNLLIIPFLVIF